MKKLLFIFTILLITTGVQAKKDRLYATFASVGAANCSFDASKNIFSAWGPNSNNYRMFSFAAGTLSNYETINITITDKDHTRIIFKDASDENLFQWTFGLNGAKSVKISEINPTSFPSEKIAQTVAIQIAGYNVSDYSEETPYTFTIDPSTVYLETAEYEGMDIKTTITSSSDKDTPFAWQADSKLSTIDNNLGTTASGVIFGYSDNNDYNHGYFDITGYDRVKFTLAEFDKAKNTTIRLLAISPETTVSFSADEGTLVYEMGVSITKCVSVKAGKGAGDCQNISSIEFAKYYNAGSTTAFNIAASTTSEVAYDRTFTAGQKSTVCFPFALTTSEASAAGTFYELTSVSGDVLTFSEVTETEAYKPYIFIAKTTGTPFISLSDKTIAATSGASTTTTVGGYTMTGTLAKQNLADGVYGWNASTGAFAKTSGTAVTIDAFRAYITAAGGARELTAVFNDVVTGIKEVNKSDNTESETYNLAGQRVSNSHKGIVIKNGRKYVVK